MATLRIYLTGEFTLELGDRLVTESDFPGRQGRLAFAFLVANRSRPITRGELADILWPNPPAQVDAALDAILSKLRAALKKTGLTTGDATLQARSGGVAVRLPADVWIDIEDAANSIDEAEGAVRVGDTKRAWGFANVVVSIARRPFLADHDAPWIEARRATLRSLLTRGLQCLATASEMGQQTSLAIQYTAEMLAIEPFRESAYQQLMRLHAASGDRAEALRVFERCRRLLRDELGTSPSPQTEAVFMKILQTGESSPTVGNR
ncbi:MAG TPA: BTAD domain-containing putative transcriptional regulator [Gemmatimonadaceae bacterium]|nr:BTAD domain-containing putative transcriptional regulator [Gemmatimonadaceae bacterium]